MTRRARGVAELVGDGDAARKVVVVGLERRLRGGRREDGDWGDMK